MFAKFFKLKQHLNPLLLSNLFVHIPQHKILIKKVLLLSAYLLNCNKRLLLYTNRNKKTTILLTFLLNV